jgi:hypothetical protein
VFSILKICVDSSNLNPDLAFQLSSESGFGSRVLMTKNWKKILLKSFVLYFGSKIAIYLSLCLLKARPSYRRNLQPSKENTQHSKK